MCLRRELIARVLSHHMVCLLNVCIAMDYFYAWRDYVQSGDMLQKRNGV